MSKIRQMYVREIGKLLSFVFAMVMLTGCETDATVASHNLSKAADMFELDRRIVFYNGITGEYMLTVEGRCSVRTDQGGRKLDVTCKTGRNEFSKHFLGLSDNVTWFSEQIGAANVSVYHNRVVFKPQTILPAVELRSSMTTRGD